ncbi:MAG: polysaccharide deacetylase [Ruminococcaceae bacterium]|nr:polysaccharide deacetylase [Oscillospiraceae bacterium]
MNFKESKKLKAVTFSYDDGVCQDIRLVELLDKYGLKCTFNINSGCLGRGGILMREGLRISHYRFAAKDLVKVYGDHEVAAHTLTHPALPRQEDDEVIRQVEEDRMALSELCGYEVVGMAYPGGGGPLYDDRVAELIRTRTGIKYARTTDLTSSFEPQSDLYRFKPNAYHISGFDGLMAQAREFAEMKTESPKIYYVWGHSYEMDYDPRYWIRLEELFEYLSKREDFFYGTNKEVLL